MKKATILKIVFVVAACMCMVLHFSPEVYSQITYDLSDLEAIFTPGNIMTERWEPHSTEMANIGGTGGPNTYDFTGFAFPDTIITYIYQVSDIPELADHYPDNGVTFGQSPQEIRHPVYLFETDIFFMMGANVLVTPDTVRINHFTPLYQWLFPITYGDNWYNSGTWAESTFVNGELIDTQNGSYWDSTTVDGYGTLQLPGYEFECLRFRYVRDDGTKEFDYFTREGLILMIFTTASEPDEGEIQISYIGFTIGGSLTGTEDPPHVPSDFLLSQNYPNPFNASTVMSYTLPRASEVSIVIYNLLAQRVATLLEDTQEAGEHTIIWDATDFPSGIYFARLLTDGYSKSIKIVFLK